MDLQNKKCVMVIDENLAERGIGDGTAIFRHCHLRRKEKSQ